MTRSSTRQSGGAEAPAARDRWLGVELRHLEALVAVAREGSFREAADALGYVQSAVSQQIAQLERLVGARLIERSRGSAPVALTDEGRLLLEHVEQILARYERAQADLTSLSDGLIGRLRVGMLPSVATRVLPLVLPRYAEQCPDVEVVPSESSADTMLFEALANGELELAFCELPIVDGPFAHQELIEDPLLLMVSASSSLAERHARVPLEELNRLALIAYSRWRGQDRALDWLAEHGVTPEVVFSSDHNATVQSLVAAGMGAALAPYLAVDAAHPGTVLLPIAEAPPRVLAIAWHRDHELSQAATTFRTLARQVGLELAGEIDQLFAGF